MALSLGGRFVRSTGQASAASPADFCGRLPHHGGQPDDLCEKRTTAAIRTAWKLQIASVLRVRAPQSHGICLPRWPDPLEHSFIHALCCRSTSRAAQVVVLLLSAPRCRAAPSPPQLDLPATFWADLDDQLKDIVSPRTRCPPSKSCPPTAREDSDTASALIRYCSRDSTAGAAGAAGGVGPSRPSGGAVEWTRCAEGQPSDWLLLQPYYKAGRIVHRFEHLFPFARQDGKHLQSLPNWAQLAPYPREWITLVCAPSGSALESDAPLDIYHEVDDASAWGSRTEGYPKSTVCMCLHCK